MRVRGTWSRDGVFAWLDAVRIPIRLGVVGPDGPRVVSLWFLRDGETLWCATQHDALIVSYLRVNPTVGFEVAVDAPPYRGVRGVAVATIDVAAGPALIDRLSARYLTARNRRLAGWLDARRDGDVAIALAVREVSSWDFSARMVPEDSDWVVPDGWSLPES